MHIILSEKLTFSLSK